MTIPSVHPMAAHPGTLFIDFGDDDRTRFYLSRHDARQLGHALLAATDPADEDPWRWVTRVEFDPAGDIVEIAPPPTGWPARRLPGDEDLQREIARVFELPPELTEAWVTQARTFVTSDPVEATDES